MPLENLIIEPTSIEPGPVPGIARFSTRPIPGALAANEFCQIVGTWTPETPAEDWLAEMKVDGIRCLYLGGEHEMLLTREGQPMGVAHHCVDGLKSIEKQYGEPMFFDGEYVEPGGFEATLAAFRRNQPLMGSLFVFDAIPLRCWLRDAPYKALRLRKQELLNLGEPVARPNVGLLGATEIEPDQVGATARSLQMLGHEGLVLKRPAAHYVRSRSPAWLKAVARPTMTVTAVELHPKKSSLKCVDRDGVEFNVALPARHLRDAQLLGDDLPGTRVDVTSKGVTANSIPREPAFARFRLDLERKF